MSFIEKQRGRLLILSAILITVFGISPFAFSVFLDAADRDAVDVGSESADLATLESFGGRPWEGDSLLPFDLADDSNLNDGWLSLPFASEPEKFRACYDVNVSLSLTARPTLILNLVLEDPKAVGQVSLYFRSGPGWFTMTGRPVGWVTAGRPTQYVFSFSDAAVEGKPIGPDKIDAVRIGFWRSAAMDSRVRLDGLFSGRNGVLSIVADETRQKGDSRQGPKLVRTLDTLGIPSTMIEADDLSADQLRDVRAVILPISAELDSAQIDLLCDYVDRGGVIFLAHAQPPKLMEKLGFSPGIYRQADQTGNKPAALTEIRFRPNVMKILGDSFPKSIHQRTHGLVVSKPLDHDRLDDFLKREENRPRVIAEWFDADDRASDLPAILVSGRGVFWSTIVNREDEISKRLYLLTIFGSMDPSFARVAVQKGWSGLFEIGGLSFDSTPESEAKRQGTLAEILRELAKNGWSANQIRLILTGKGETDETIRLVADMEKVRERLATAYCRSLRSKPNEARLIWEHSGRGPYPGDWDRTMRELSEAGFNGIVTNMLSGGRAMFASEFIPNDPIVQTEGDQLAQAVAAGKKHGVEIHVWKVNYNCHKASRSFLDRMEAEGRLQRSFGGESKSWLCPSHPLNQKLEADAMLETAVRYEIDGIHFDYIRYGNADVCYCDGCRERFGEFYEKTTGKPLQDWPGSTRSDEDVKGLWQEWRRDQITTLVREVRRRVRMECPDCLVSAAVFPSYPGCRESIAQDWLLWVKEGLLDFICPMDYEDNVDHFEVQATAQRDLIDGKIPFYPGIGVMSSQSMLTQENTALQIERARALGADGFVIFCLNATTAAEILPALASGVTRTSTVPHHRLPKKEASLSEN